MDWDAVYASLRFRYIEALVNVPRPDGDPFMADVQLTNYPPRIHVDVCYPVRDGRRKEAYHGIGEGAVLAELTDDELRAAADYAMRFYEACGDGLKIYRDRRPEKGVVRYTIKPLRYKEWERSRDRGRIQPQATS